MNNKKIYIETYGCQMNLSDTEIVSSILESSGYDFTDSASDADIILFNTCSVRDNAERKIFEKINHLKPFKKKNNKLVVGIMGCMAERLRSKLIEGNDIVNFAIGPDQYKKIPELLSNAFEGIKATAVNLSRYETYDDIIPLRKKRISAWLSIMRGCDNFCSYCVVPYTRGRERSRNFNSLLKEVELLQKEGFKEMTLLGQNVNSYHCKETNKDFPDLISSIAELVPNMRIRFTTSHPKDISDKLIDTIAKYDNICNHIHLAMQSGSNRILELMERKYTIEHYLERIEKIKSTLGNVSLTTDIIAGFPTETIEDHKATLEAIEKIKYDGAFMFRYSPRENTKAYKMEDDVPEEEKLRRLNEIIDLQQRISKEINQKEIGNVYDILVEGPSKKKKSEWLGRTNTNKVVIFPTNDNIMKGDFIKVQVKDFTSATLFGELIA